MYAYHNCRFTMDRITGCNSRQRRAGIVKGQDCSIVVAILRPETGTVLAHAHPVTVPVADKRVAGRHGRHGHDILRPVHDRHGRLIQRLAATPSAPNTFMPYTLVDFRPETVSTLT